jgi:hypothetical protein
MATTSLNPGVGPTNADIATAVAAPSAATIAAAVAAPSAATIASAVAAPSSATIASAVAAAVPTTAGITSIVQANAGSPFGGTYTNLGFQSGSGVNTITFSSLGGYKYLRFVVMGFYPSAGGPADIGFRFNGDSGSNYKFHMAGGGTSGTPAFNYGDFSTYGFICSSGNQNTVYFDFEIPGSNSSAHKIARCLGGFHYTGGQYVNNTSGFTYWGSTAAITSISIFLTASTGSGANTGIYMYGAN